MKHDNCPTCGTKLGPLRDHERVRRCDACRRPNPRGFNYCGFCAAPMENTALRAKMSELAAPEGGWPSLARELIEVKFFVDRGDLSEAFEMMQVLRLRWPGHPELRELEDLTPSSRPKKIHTQVNRVVDAVLADSADWTNRPVRRAAPRWQAPAGKGDEGRTQGHVAVGRDEVDEDAKTLAPPGGGLVNKRVHAGPQTPRLTRRGHQVPGPFPVIPVINPSFRDAAEAEAEAEASEGMTGAQPVVAVPPAGRAATAKKKAKSTSAKHRATTGSRTGPKTSTGKSRASAKSGRKTNKQPPVDSSTLTQPPRSGSVQARDDTGRVVDRADRKVVAQENWGTARGHTVAVDALHPATPFLPDDDEVDTVRQKADDGTPPKPRNKGGKKKGKQASKRKRRPVDDSPESDDKRKAQAARRAAKFGQNILGR